MTTLRCLILDDEPLALDLLEDNISKLPYLQLVSRCRNAFAAIEAMQQNPVDLLFTDIQMPGLTGLQFLQTLQNRPMVILVTAYEQYALEGFNLDVVDYLLKPVSYERFVKACNKALELYNLKQQSAASPRTEDRNFIFLQVDYKQMKVMLDEIELIEALKDYVKIHFTGGRKPLLVRISMKALEEMLPPARFIRIHKSYIVSVNSITAVRRNTVFIGEQELPVSEAYRDTLQRLTQ